MSFTAVMKDRISLARATKINIASESLLKRAELPFREVCHGHYHVADAFTFWPATGYWRSHDGLARGYGVGNLIALAKAVPA